MITDEYFKGFITEFAKNETNITYGKLHEFIEKYDFRKVFGDKYEKAKSNISKHIAKYYYLIGNYETYLYDELPSELKDELNLDGVYINLIYKKNNIWIGVFCIWKYQNNISIEEKILSQYYNSFNEYDHKLMFMEMFTNINKETIHPDISNLNWKLKTDLEMLININFINFILNGDVPNKGLQIVNNYLTDDNFKDFITSFMKENEINITNFDNYLSQNYKDNKLRKEYFSYIAKYHYLNQKYETYLFKDIPTGLKELLQLNDATVNVIYKNGDKWYGVHCKWKSRITDCIKKPLILKYFEKFKNTKLNGIIFFTNVDKRTSYRQINKIEWLTRIDIDKIINNKLIDFILNRNINIELPIEEPIEITPKIKVIRNKPYTFEQIKQTFEENNYVLVSIEYKYGDHLEYICNRGHNGSITFEAFKTGRRCKICSNEKNGEKKRVPFETIQAIFTSENCTLISKQCDYKNGESLLKYLCANGHMNECSLVSFKNKNNKCKCDFKIKKACIYTTEQVKGLCIEKGFVFMSINFESKKVPFKIKCRESHETMIIFSQLDNIQPCIVCNNYKNAKITIDSIREEAIGRNFTLISTEYKLSSEPLKFICPNKHEIEIPYSNWKRSFYGCNTCARQESNKNIAHSYDFVKSKFIERNYELITPNYENAYQQLEYICDNKHKGTITFDGFYFSQYGCQICSGYKKYNIDSVREIFKKEGYILLSDKYENSNAKLKYKCPKDHINSICLNAFNVGNRCPDCKQSKGESSIARYFNNEQIIYETQKKFNDCKNKQLLPFDVYVNNQFLIEFDGRQHFSKNDFFGGENGFKNTQQNDIIKTKYCITNKIPLLRISHEEIKKIPEIIKKFMEILKIHNKEKPLVYFSNNVLYEHLIKIYEDEINL